MQLALLIEYSILLPPKLIFTLEVLYYKKIYGVMR